MGFVDDVEKERKKDILTSSKAKIGPGDKWFTNGIFTHASKSKTKIKIEFKLNSSKKNNKHVQYKKHVLQRK